MRKKTTIADLPIVVIDGEGATTESGSHIYNYMAAVTENGDLISDIANEKKGLSTAALLDYLVSLAIEVYPNHTSPHLSVFIFAGGYDFSKILEDLPDMGLWLLARPEERAIRPVAPEIPETYDRDRGLKKARNLFEYTPKVITGADKRKPLHAKRGVRWTDPGGNTYVLHFQRGCFTVQRVDDEVQKPTRNKDGRERTVVVGPKLTIWDCWSFFSTSLVNALKGWNIGTKEEIASIAKLKAQRGNFVSVPFEQIKAYCHDECRLAAQMIRKLITAHIDAGLVLRNFYGAGSSGAAMLTKWGAKEWLGQPPNEMKYAIAQAYFGGRFEQAWSGEVYGRDPKLPLRDVRQSLVANQPCYGYDVSSAYPYAQSQGMPCMRHGNWNLIQGTPAEVHQAVAEARYALVMTRVDKGPQDAWGPFPWRCSDGNVIYPLTSPGTWVWRPEYMAAKNAPHCWNIEAEEAWIYSTDCNCKPFAEVPLAYKLRLEIGKEGPGLAIKLGINSSYGKTCQSVGDPPYQCWVWAGMTTSHCRAQILDGIAAAPSAWDVFQVATDGIFSRVRLKLPKPADTGTSQIIGPPSEKCSCPKTGAAGDGIAAGVEVWGDPNCKRHVQKPLGGWEEKDYPKGIFCVRPGAYFPLDFETRPIEEETDKDREKVRGRGVGRKSMAEHRRGLVAHWREWRSGRGPARGLPYPVNYTFESVSTFIGFKAGVHGHPVDGAKTRVSGDPVRVARSTNYGRWVERPQQLSFFAQPKRECMTKNYRLVPWESPGRYAEMALLEDAEVESESSVYQPAVGAVRVLSEIDKALIEAEREALDQPDYDEEDFTLE